MIYSRHVIKQAVICTARECLHRTDHARTALPSTIFTRRFWPEIHPLLQPASTRGRASRNISACQIDPLRNLHRIIPVKAWPHLASFVALSSCVTLTEVQEHPQLAPRDHTAGATARELSNAILGVWIFPQIDPEVSPVVIYLNTNATYARETGGAIFEKGRWSLHGNQLVLTPTQGAPVKTTVQAISANELIWDAGGSAPMRLTRS